MPTRPLELVRLLMRCDVTAPRMAREAVKAFPAIDSVRDEATLIASELVSNAVLHAGCGPDDVIELVIQQRARAVRLSITDQGRSEEAPQLRGSDYAGRGGAGLQIVDTLASRWGSEQRNGTLVWAELALNPGPRGAQSRPASTAAS